MKNTTKIDRGNLYQNTFLLPLNVKVNMKQITFLFLFYISDLRRPLSSLIFSEIEQHNAQ